MKLTTLLLTLLLATPSEGPPVPALRGAPHAASHGWGAPLPPTAPTGEIPERAMPMSATTGIGSVLIAGTASWYCGAVCTHGYPGGMYAAAGSELRVGDWRGRHVTVCAVAGRPCVEVTLIDTCACPGARVIDLYRDAFSRLADPSRGVIPVTVEYGVDVPLPQTDTEDQP